MRFHNTFRVLVDNTPSADPIQDSSDDEIDMTNETEEQGNLDQPGPSFVLPVVERPEDTDANMDEFDCPQLILDAGFQEKQFRYGLRL